MTPAERRQVHRRRRPDLALDAASRQVAMRRSDPLAYIKQRLYDTAYKRRRATSRDEQRLEDLRA